MRGSSLSGCPEVVLAGASQVGEPDVGRVAATINLLDDVAAVLEPGEDAAWSEVLCRRLAELRPGTYSGWTADQLARALKPFGVTTGQIGRRVDGEVVNRRGITTGDLAGARRARQFPGPDSSQPANG